jgi:tRNA-uridine 2-sulfurtransferase
MFKKQKVFVGISGGVDSSVALALLKKRGFDATGVFLKVWNPEFLSCNWKEERRSAMRVCATLHVPFLTFDCEKEYKKEVVDYMIREYGVGRIPNPDIFCNKYIKFGVFLKKALKMGADYIATGHYARINKNMKQYELLEGIDKNKDQSYFLYTLNQKQLTHSLFPIGELTKTKVRNLAKKFGLPTAEKKDSQGICFLGKIDVKDFLSHYINTKKGDVLNVEGEIIGFHNGAAFLTIGQRHGFTVTKKSNKNPRFFVISKDLKKNTITVANKVNERKIIYSIKKIYLSNVHFINKSKPKFPLKTKVRFRYRQQKQKCILDKEQKKYVVNFNKPQSAIAEGQAAVFYDGEMCLGGGIIEKTS